MFADASFYSTQIGAEQLVPDLGYYYFCISSTPQNDIAYMEKPSFRHNLGVNAAFADGHAVPIHFNDVYAADHQLRPDWFDSSPLRLR